RGFFSMGREKTESSMVRKEENQLNCWKHFTCLVSSPGKSPYLFIGN
ncbi:uncharacterized protein METZ01_LOCUS266086, partial [marine metagenome]